MDLVGFADRWVWVGNSFWRLQDDDFEISIGGFSIMDNHLHFLLRFNVEQVSQWSAMEVARRWMALYPPRGSDRKPLTVTDDFLKLKADNAAWVAATRKRLSSLGWFMKCLKEPLARLANKQDGGKTKVSGCVGASRRKVEKQRCQESLFIEMVSDAMPKCQVRLYQVRY